MIRTKMFIKYARMNLQEAEAAIQDGAYKNASKKCKDCVVSLAKAVKEAYPRENLQVDPVDVKKLGLMLADLMDSKDRAEVLTSMFEKILSEAEKEAISRIHAEELLSLAGNAFQAIHDLFSPTLPKDI